MINSLTVNGLRGFGEEKTINFAVPNGSNGSGLTIIVGANNTGKTTIIEALRAFNSNKDNPPTFSERKRNIKCDGGKVHLKIITSDNEKYAIDTIDRGGSTTIYRKEGCSDEDCFEGLELFVLPSRRFAEYEFYYSNMSRADYIRNQQLNFTNRSANIYEFNARLFKMQNNEGEFNDLLKRVLGYDLDWVIEQNDNGTYYLKLNMGGCVHSSEGMGDGIWSVFTICDALYDSQPNSFIAIDEPELSLHPAYQKKIMDTVKEYAKDRQIILNTHSPYFIDFESIINGGFLYRTSKNNNGNIDINCLSEESRINLKGFLNDFCQPHTLSTEAKEIFFLDDNVIVTEGQEDVVMYNNATKQLNVHLSGNFFGWGSAGASNIKKIARILKDLGYKKVVAIFDGDRKDDYEAFEKEFINFKGLSISTLDVRDKPDANKCGLMTNGGEVKPEYENELKQMFANINDYFKS